MRKNENVRNYNNMRENVIYSLIIIYVYNNKKELQNEELHNNPYGLNSRIYKCLSHQFDDGGKKKFYK